MRKIDKILLEDSVKRELVLKVLELFDNESVEDALEILNIARVYLHENSFMNFPLARDVIGSLNAQDD